MRAKKPLGKQCLQNTYYCKQNLATWRHRCSAALDLASISDGSVSLCRPTWNVDILMWSLANAFWRRIKRRSVPFVIRLNLLTFLFNGAGLVSEWTIQWLGIGYFSFSCIHLEQECKPNAFDNKINIWIIHVSYSLRFIALYQHLTNGCVTCDKDSNITLLSNALEKPNRELFIVMCHNFSHVFLNHTTSNTISMYFTIWNVRIKKSQFL